jgi:hypothetical protein
LGESNSYLHSTNGQSLVQTAIFTSELLNKVNGGLPIYMFD